MKRLSFILLIAIGNIIFCSCSSTSDKKDNIEKSGKSFSSPSFNRSNTNDEAESDEVLSKCKIEDGTHSATVDYNNPETGYSNTYTLDVDVESCQVVKINFPKGGWLDEDHIDPAAIGEDGNASVLGENGKTYEVHIGN